MAKPTEAVTRINDTRLDLVPTLADCDPWMIPTEYNVVVAPAETPKTVGKHSVILAPDSTRENADLAMQIGRLVSVSPVAFNYERWPEGTAPPQVGDIVWFARYAGFPFEGADGKTYRLVKDKDVGAIIDIAALQKKPEAAIQLAATQTPAMDRLLSA